MSSPDATGGFEDVRDEADGHPMRSLFAYARPYWKRLTAGVIASVINRACRLLPALIIAATIDRVIQAPGEPAELARIGLITSEVIPAEATGQRLGLLYVLAGIAAAVYVVQAIFHYVSRYFFQTTAQRIQHDLRHDTYDHMQRLSVGFFNDHETGGMMSILNNDINRLEKFFNSEIRQIVRAVVVFALVGGYMLLKAPELAPLVLVPVIVIALVTAKFIVWIEPKYKRIRELVAELNTRLSNNLGGPTIIKSFDRYEVETGRVDERSAGYRDEKIDAIKIRKAFFASLRLLVGVMFVSVLVFGGRQVVAGSLTAGTFVVFFMYLRYLDGPMTRIGKTANKYQKTQSSAERVFGVLGHEPAITSPEDPVVPDDVDGDVRFEDVTFSYGDAGAETGADDRDSRVVADGSGDREGDRAAADADAERVLEGVDLDVPAGTTVGLAGTSGSGKSTLLKLVSRFYDPDDGRVTIDGIDAREYDVQALREEVGIVEQDPYMFSGTIRDNIAYGDRELFAELRSGNRSRETQRHIEEAAAAAGAHEFIQDLPDGYDTEVGERGVKLSGGQRQRVSIARTILNDPAIVILDEATSDVDTETEQLIQRNLDRLIADRTAFVIAHRLSTIRDADRIVVMEDGEIIETGTHTELVADHGTYADLWNTQADVAPGTASTD